MRDIIVVAHNLRSAHNVGSLLRTADGLGVSQVYLTGYTPHPSVADDSRLPHEQAKLDHQIQKTALGAEKSQAWIYAEDCLSVLADLKVKGFQLAALEQCKGAQLLADFKPPAKLVLVIGREVEGIEATIIAACDYCLEIPMLGAKESFNVVQATAMALFHCRYSQRA